MTLSVLICPRTNMPPRETYVMREGRLVPKRGAKRDDIAPRGPQIIRDIEPYRSVAFDIASGKRVLVGGRAQHREFLRRNNYVEVGNDDVTPGREELSRADRIADIRRALRDW
jgi:hypothetical protein